jgi:hypothetical protein
MSHFNQYHETPKVRTDGESVNQQETDQVGNQKVTQPALAVRTVTVGSITYVGQAPVGTATSVALWQIQKVDSTSGVVVTWADGNDRYDNVWDDYATLTYS